MKNNLGWAFLLLAAISATSGWGEWAPSVANLPEAQRAALQTAIRFAEPEEAVREVLADLASAPAGTSQQELLKSKLSSANLSFFCLTSELNREGNATDYEYEVPSVEMVGEASIHTVTNASVVVLDDVVEVSWQDAAPGQAHGSFRYDTKSGYKGRCLFLAAQAGTTWTITQLAIQKKGSGLLEEGYVVFSRAARLPLNVMPGP